MGKNLQKLFSFRTDEDIIKKLNYISAYNSRTRNKEIEFVLKEHIRLFEREYGKIDISEVPETDQNAQSHTTVNNIAVIQKNKQTFN